MKDSASPDGDAPALTARQVERTITDNLPPIDHHGEVVESVGPVTLRIRLPFQQTFMGAAPCAHVTSTYRVARREPSRA